MSGAMLSTNSLRQLTRTSSLLSRSLATPSALPTVHSTSSSPPSQRRKNRRTLRSSPSHITNSLTELYHLSSTFLPLSSPDPTIVHVFTPTSEKTPAPRLLSDYEVKNNKREIGNMAISYTHALPSVASQKWADCSRLLNLEVDDLFGYQTRDIIGENKGALQRSFESVVTRGVEPPLSRRLRRVMDTLFQTSGGAQAGEIDRDLAELERRDQREMRWSVEREKARVEMESKKAARQEEEAERVWAQSQ